MTLDDLKAFSDPAREEDWKQAPFSFQRFTFATNGCVLVRVARCADAPENKAGQRVASFFEWNFPKPRDVKFEAWPSVPPKVKTAIAIGGRHYSVQFCRLIGALPKARCGILRGQRAADAAEAEADGYVPPLAFIAGEGNGAKAEICGLLMPLKTEVAQ